MIKNIHGRTLELLGEAVVSGRYAIGASIPSEPVLGEELGVSRTVVREAIKSLVAKGLIVTGPKVGTRVLPKDKWNWFDPDVITWQARAGLTPEFLRDLQDLRRVVEPMITLSKEPTLANKRLAFNRLRDRDSVVKLFAELGPRFKARPGGYTRILKMGFRVGDNAPMALVELVDRPADVDSSDAAKA